MEETMIAGNTSSNELYNPLGNQFQSMGNSFQSRVIIIPDKIEATAPSLVDFFQNNAANNTGVIDAPYIVYAYKALSKKPVDSQTVYAKADSKRETSIYCPSPFFSKFIYAA